MSEQAEMSKPRIGVTCSPLRGQAYYGPYLRAVEAAGAFSVVLESIPRELAARITADLRIPTIGIGAGPECDGQILVLHDMIGLSLGHTPKFTRRYTNVGEAISQAVTAYAEDVRDARFPADEESYHLSSEVRERLLAPRRR